MLIVFVLIKKGCISYVLRFVGILKTLILQNSLQLATTGCEDSLIKSTQHAAILLKVSLL